MLSNKTIMSRKESIGLIATNKLELIQPYVLTWAGLSSRSFRLYFIVKNGMDELCSYSLSQRLSKKIVLPCRMLQFCVLYCKHGYLPTARTPRDESKRPNLLGVVAGFAGPRQQWLAAVRLASVVLFEQSLRSSSRDLQVLSPGGPSPR